MAPATIINNAMAEAKMGRSMKKFKKFLLRQGRAFLFGVV
jgi:hypothetical protein